MKKIIYYIILLNFIFACSFANEDISSRSLTVIENNLEEAKTMYDKALLINDVYLWLQQLSKMKYSKEETLALLKKAHPLIEKITVCGDDMTEFFHPQTPYETIDVQLGGTASKAFLNMRANLYQEEVKSYAKYRQFDRFELTNYNLANLDKNHLYNFVVTQEEKLYLSSAQDFDLVNEGKVKAIITPNHPLLADGQPILTAGELIVLGNDRVKIYLVGITSGHYRPNYATREHMIKSLLALGVAREQIITTVFSIHNIGWKFVTKSARENKAF